MDYFIIGKLVAILLLVAGNAFFVGSEIALTSARRSRIQQLADLGDHNAKIVQILHDEPERFYSVTQVGITLVSLALGAIGIVTITEVAEPVIDATIGHLSMLVEPKSAHIIAHTTAQVFAFIVISFLHIVGGELAPKVYAFHNAVALSLVVSRIINLLYKSFFGAIWLLNHASNGLLRLFGQSNLIGPAGGHFSISEEELRTILMASEREGILNPEETRMIRGVFDLEDQKVADAMVPRIDVKALPSDSTISAALEILRANKHTRYPVYDGTIDKIVGILLVKDMLAFVETPEARSLKISEIMRPAYVIPDTKPLDLLLKKFKESRQQMAVVMDEYGGTAGIITLEDIIEEIVGDLDDEFTVTEKFVRKQEDVVVIDARVEIDELSSEVEFPFPEGDYNTLAGLMYARLARVPQIGDTVDLPGGKLTVTDMTGNRITSVAFERVREPSEVDSKDGNGEPD